MQQIFIFHASVLSVAIQMHINEQNFKTWILYSIKNMNFSLHCHFNLILNLAFMTY